MSTPKTLLWLGILSGSLVLSNGRWTVPAAAWLAPALLLRFVDSQRAPTGLKFGFLTYLAAYCLMWRGLIPAPGMLYFVIVGSYASVYFLPFVAHRLLAGRIGGWVSTLIFPSAWVAGELALERLTPYGSWLSAAYTQAHAQSLMQVLAVTGLTGVSFLLAWFAALLAWSWGLGFEWRSIRGGAIAFFATLALVLGIGEMRLRLAPAPRATVRLAAIAPRPSLQRALDKEMARVRWEGIGSGAVVSPVIASAEALVSDLFQRTEREARAGAKVIAWSETAARVLKQQEPAFIARARRVAAEQGIYLFPAYGVWSPGSTPPFENKVIAIDPHGTLAWQFLKAHPAPGPESSMIAPGDRRLRVLDTPYGRFSAVICHDLDFPRLIRQAGQARVDVLLGPSADWRDIAVLHADMASARAVENGLSLVRPAEGLSIVTDSLGRRLGSAASLSGDGVSLVVQCPLGGSPTLYPSFGDAFAWGATLLFVALLLRQLARSRRQQSARTDLHEQILAL